VKEVESHPIALMQCENFLDTLPGIKIVEHEDTALAARDISEKKLLNTAAICSTRAAQIYGLTILASGIETNKHNFTRFLIFGNEWIVSEIQKNETLTRASIVFTLPHKEGSLSKVLSVFSFYDINLTKIQSLPIIGREWEYKFYVDFKFLNIERYRQSLVAIKPLVNELQTLGEYPEGRQSAL
jgi:prephenate dehydratase